MPEIHFDPLIERMFDEEFANEPEVIEGEGQQNNNRQVTQGPPQSDPLIEQLAKESEENAEQTNSGTAGAGAANPTPAGAGASAEEPADTEKEIEFGEDTTDWQARATAEGLLPENHGEIKSRRDYLEAVDRRDRYDTRFWNTNEFRQYEQFMSIPPAEAIQQSIFENAKYTQALNPDDEEDLATLNNYVKGRMAKCVDPDGKLNAFGEQLYAQQQEMYHSRAKAVAEKIGAEHAAERARISEAEKKIGALLKSGEKGRFSDGEQAKILEYIFSREHEIASRIDRNLDDPAVLLENALWANPKTRQKMLAHYDREKKIAADTNAVNKAI